MASDTWLQLYLISSQPVAFVFAAMKAISRYILVAPYSGHFRGFDPIVFDARPQKKNLPFAINPVFCLPVEQISDSDAAALITDFPVNESMTWLYLVS